LGPELRELAIVLAILAAVALAFGAQFQNQAVSKSTEKTPRRRGSLSLKELGDFLSVRVGYQVLA
jgi:hypothetical protein